MTEPPAADSRSLRILIGLSIVPEVASQLARLVADTEDCVLRLVAPVDIHLTLVPPWNEPSSEAAIERLGGPTALRPRNSRHFARRYSRRSDRPTRGPFVRT